MADGPQEDVAATLTELERRLKELERELEEVGSGRPHDAGPSTSAARGPHAASGPPPGAVAVPPPPGLQDPRAPFVAEWRGGQAPPPSPDHVVTWHASVGPPPPAAPFTIPFPGPAAPPPPGSFTVPLPPEPAPFAVPPPGGPSAAADLRARLEELQDVRAQLVAVADRLVEELASAVAELEGAKAEPVLDGRVIVTVEPIADLAVLSAFEQALRIVPGVREAGVRSLQDGRAEIDVTLDRPIVLTGELRRVAPRPFRVTAVGGGRLSLAI